MIDMEFDQKLRSMETYALTDIALSRENLQLFTAKLNALATIKRRCYKYREHGFRSELILAVWAKKLGTDQKGIHSKAVRNHSTAQRSQIS